MQLAHKIKQRYCTAIQSPAGWISIVTAVVLSAFFFFDEEPCLDPTDWNITHIVLLLLSIIIVVNDNVMRSRNGQFVFKDQVLLFTTFSFWFAIENWCRLIVVVFCFHCLAPLELELIELSDAFVGLQLWYTTKIIPAFLISVFVYLILQLLNFSLNWLNIRTVLSLTFVCLLVLSLTFLTMLWDFLLSSSTSINFSSTKSLLYYNNSRSSLAYDAALGVDDLFDWHISNSNSFVFRFEDAYCFFLQLFNIVAIYTLIFILLFFVLDLLFAKDSSIATVASNPSYLFLSVILRWFDHVWFSFFISHFSIFFVSLRIFFKVCLDFNL